MRFGVFQRSGNSSIFCSPEANRTIAKYALNLLAHRYGLPFVTDKFRALKDFVLGKASNQTVGVFWNPSLLKSLPFAVPEHLFIIYADGTAHRVTVFIWLFSLFPYEFFLMTGEREQEVMYTYWSDVNFAASTVRVSHKPDRGWTPKAYKEREIPIPAKLVESLRAWKAKSDKSWWSGVPHCRMQPKAQLP